MAAESRAADLSAEKIAGFEDGNYKNVQLVAYFFYEDNETTYINSAPLTLTYEQVEDAANKGGPFEWTVSGGLYIPQRGAVVVTVNMIDYAVVADVILHCPYDLDKIEGWAEDSAEKKPHMVMMYADEVDENCKRKRSTEDISDVSDRVTKSAKAGPRQRVRVKMFSSQKVESSLSDSQSTTPGVVLRLSRDEMGVVFITSWKATFDINVIYNRLKTLQEERRIAMERLANMMDTTTL